MQTKKTALLSILLFFGLGVFAQSRTITGNITQNTTLSADSIYILDGYVYVKNGATLTIQPGTIIKGKSGNRSTLIVTRGSKLHAEGTPTRPIIFTSDKTAGNRAGSDWGGIVLLGKATINRASDCNTCPGASVASSEPGVQNNIEGDLDNSSGDGLYGGTDDNDNSGVLKYVRIEFGGSVITTGNEINSLTLGAVGRNTVIENVQVSYGYDDSYEWFGGTVNAKRLISFGCGDDDFDTDFGYRGMVQYGIILRDSNEYDKGAGPTTNGFESDNDAGGTQANPFTAPVFSNITVVGPAYATNVARFNNALRIRRNSSLSLFNSVVIGFPYGIFLDGAGTYNKYINDSAAMKNLIIAGYGVRALNSNTSQSGLEADFMNGNGNDTVKSLNGLIRDPYNYSNPDFRAETSGLASSGSSFSGAKISDAFFNNTNFRGAMGQNDWSRCWSDYTPQTNSYTSPNYNTANKSGAYYKGAIANFTPAMAASLKVSLTNNSTKADAYLWDFGVSGSTTDTSTSMSPEFTYSAAGMYTIKLIAFSECGNDTASVQFNVTGVKEDLNFASYGVYPNPANSTANVAFTLKNNSDLDVSVLDMTGRKVAQIASGSMPAGEMIFSLPLENLSAGTYFVRLASGSSTVTMKLIVVK